MINKSDLEKTDSGKMFKIYDDWPEIAKNAYLKAKSNSRKPVKHFSTICFFKIRFVNH